MKKTAIIFAAFCLAAVSGHAYEIRVEAGQLGRHIADINKEKPSVLTVTGSLDVRDFARIKDLAPEVKTINLSAATIKAYTYSSGGYLGQSQFKAGEVPQYSFFDSRATQISLPSSATSIGAGALAHTQLSAVTIPGGVTEIGDYAFYDNPRLQTLTLPAAVSKLGTAAAAKCTALQSADFSKSRLSVIPAQCFQGCSTLTSVYLPSSIVTVGREAFAGSGVNSLTLTSLKTAEPYAFADMPDLQDITLGADTQLGRGALFLDPQLAKVAGVPAKMAEHAIAGTPSLDLNLHLENVTHIGEYAFAGNNSTTVKFGPQLTSISDNAFHATSAVKTVDARPLQANIPAVEGDPFSKVDTSAVDLVVTPDSRSQWMAHDYFKNFNVVTEMSVISELPHDEAAISISREGNRLLVTSAAPLSRLEAYDLDGRALLTLAPDATEVNALLDTDPNGVIVVKAVAGNTVRITKLK